MLSAREYFSPLMVVDDEPADIDIFRHRLKLARVCNPLLTFENSAEALAFLRSLATAEERPFLTPSAMFLDINMPHVHGFVFLKWVRAQPEFDDVRIVILSGSDRPADRDRAFKLGADDYLVKFPPAEAFARALAKLGEAVAVAE